MNDTLTGTGEVFRRDEGRNSLCTCIYELTSTRDAAWEFHLFIDTRVFES